MPSSSCLHIVDMTESVCFSSVSCVQDYLLPAASRHECTVLADGHGLLQQELLEGLAVQNLTLHPDVGGLLPC